MMTPPQGEWKLGANWAYESNHRRILPRGHCGFGMADSTARAETDVTDDEADREAPFWRRKPLADMTDSEWESLCDGCGKCCLNKLEEEETDRTYYTDVGCRLLDGLTCRCRDYANRLDQVEDCVQLTPENLKTITWLPPSCAYVLIANGKDLYWWHPLVSGDSESVHAAGVSVRGRVGASETDVPDADLEDHIVSWPVRLPKAARRR